jgi:transposase-like protein
METTVTRGRPPEGPGLVEKLEGPEDDRRRLRAILETISGQRTIASACEELGIKPARFHELRTQALQGALEAIAPGSPGRPPAPDSTPDPKVAELEAKVRDLDLELRASHVREQIALTMPHLLEPERSAPEPEPLKKTKSSKALDRLEKERHRHHRPRA